MWCDVVCGVGFGCGLWGRVYAQDELDGVNDEEELDAPDDADDPDDLEEYEAWKVRELKRIIRDRDVRRKVEMEQAELERRRGESPSRVGTATAATCNVRN